MNTLVLEVGASLERTFPKRIFAREALEVEAPKVVEASGLKAAPVEASFLLRCAFVVGISRVAEGLCVAPTSCGSLLEEKSSRDSGSKKFHIANISKNECEL